MKANLHPGCVYGGREERWAWVQSLVFPFAELCSLLLSQDWPTQNWLWEDWHLSILCLYEILLLMRKQNLIIGQARKEGKECCLSDRLQGGAVTRSETDLLLCCGLAALARCEAITPVLREYANSTAETRSFTEMKSVISALCLPRCRPYLASRKFLLGIFFEVILPCVVQVLRN